MLISIYSYAYLPRRHQREIFGQTGSPPLSQNILEYTPVCWTTSLISPHRWCHFLCVLVTDDVTSCPYIKSPHSIVTQILQYGKLELISLVKSKIMKNHSLCVLSLKENYGNHNFDMLLIGTWISQWCHVFLWYNCKLQHLVMKNLIALHVH